jgi:uncharacterized protein YcbK (DUF882 family)
LTRLSMVRRLRVSLLVLALSAGALAPLGGNPSGLSSLSFSGLSGKLRAIFALPTEKAFAEIAALPRKPGVYSLAGILPALENLNVVVLTPFSAKVNGRIGTYRMGHWPYENRAPRDPMYANPKGFIEVTPDNFAFQVSEHFALGEFVTKDQGNVWPKYVALDQRLLDKLELTIAELNRAGYSVDDLHVMSGFRTPQYNEQGVGAGGRSAVSRHQYGDAADVYPDDDRDGRIDDLNRDGRVNLEDARVLAAAADAVERRNPGLAGGVGLYPATSAHGPMVHIDARGKKARWVYGS